MRDEEGDEEDANVTVYALRTSQQLITCNTSNLFEIWEASDASPSFVKSWKVQISAMPLIYRRLMHRPFWS